MELVIALVAVVVAIIAWSSYKTKKRRAYLMDKYNDTEIVNKIMSKTIWQGMSQEQLMDSWGRPVATDEKVYKSSIKVTFKYDQTGKNRFRRRVYLDNGQVSGWEQK